MNQSLAVEVLKPAKPAIVPKLKCGGDAMAAKKLLKLYSDAQVGMRKIVALGITAWEIKETHLKHGEWGPWLAAHAPKLCRLDTGTDKPKASASLSNYMELTRNVLEGVGFPTIEKYLAEAAKFPNLGICGGGGFLLIADKKVPEAVRPLREKIFALVDNKTQRQLFLEFKQAEEQPDGTKKKKRGRLPGQGGNSKEALERARLLKEEEEVTALNLWCEETAAAIMERADDVSLGRPGVKDSADYKKLMDAVKYLQGWAKHGGEA